MDALSDVLSLLRLEDYGSAGFDACGPWSLAFPQDEGIRFYAVVSGTCWLAIDGEGEPMRLAGGDCVLLPRGRAFRLATDLALASQDAFAVFEHALGGVATLQGGGDFFGVGGYFEIAGENAHRLIGMLPPLIHIGNESEKDVLLWCVERMRLEIRDPQPGGYLVARQLATMLLVAALRVHLAQHAGDGIGWLFALGDARMAAALNAMHRDPAARWTVASLASRVGMSRTSFALAFKKTVGESPLEYLTRWRMERACDRLAHSNDAIAEIAYALGYESESAFSAAFKRVKGCAPRRYRR